jgi:hypothetical protein
MSMEANGGPARTVDVRGIAVAVSAVLAMWATFLVTPGSGVGPAALAVLAWFALLWLASWVAFIDDHAGVRHWLGAIMFAAAGCVGLIATVESPWALAFPGVALAVVLGRKRSLACFLAAVAWVVAITYTFVG